MRIRVVRYKGRMPDAEHGAEFGVEGGTIGRHAECTLALADPDRHISRVQAEVLWRDGGFVVIDRGAANPVQRNGETLGAGRQAPLVDGDELQMADYVLRVEAQPTAGSPAGPGFDPFEGLLPSRVAPPPPRADHPLARIPDDFDLLGTPAPAGKPPDPPFGVPSAPLSALPSAAPVQSLDALFDLDRVSADPLQVGASLGVPLAQPNTSAGADPLSALQAPLQVPCAPVADRGDQIHGQFSLPQQAGGDAGFRSWDSPEGISRTTIVGVRPAAEPDRPLDELVDEAAAMHSRDFAPLPNTRITEFVDGLNQHARVPDPRAGAPSGAAPAGAAVAPDALLAAFLAGAGLRELPRDPLAPGNAPRPLDEAMLRRLGALLRLYSDGTLQLLAARVTTKREMRADVTSIEPRGNNPLKFSPDAGVALGHLLMNRTLRGFMDPERAVRDAFDDLRAHQIGVFTGVRAAMSGLLARFDPAVLEQRLTRRGVLDSMLPMHHKARTWELFQELYAEISREAEDDFDAVFGREFVKAYEAQIDALQARNDPPPQG